jgi:hypothetical protein
MDSRGIERTQKGRGMITDSPISADPVEMRNRRLTETASSEATVKLANLAIDEAEGEKVVSPERMDSPTTMDSPEPVDSPTPMDSPATMDSPEPVDSPTPMDSPELMDSPVLVDSPSDSPLNEEPKMTESPVNEEPTIMDSPIGL